VGGFREEMKKGATRATILVANDPQTHVASPIKRNNAKTCRKTCTRTGSVGVGTIAATNGSEVRGPPIFGARLGPFAARQHSHLMFPFNRMASIRGYYIFCHWTKGWASFHMREKFVSFNTGCRPGSEPFMVRRRSVAGTSWLGDHPDVRGRSDFWAGTH
jgi:hypothetical protein